MKQFIITLVLLPFLMFFPFQHLLDSLNHSKTRAFDNIVQESVQAARIEGYFTSENINNLRSNLARVFYINESRIIINVTTIPKYRGKTFDETEFIDYEIIVPVENIIAMPQFWGYGESTNKVDYPARGSVGSERLQ